jgi:plastocyanin
LTQDGKRRRGRRRGKREEPGRAVPPDEQQQKQSDDLEIDAQSDVPGVTGSRFSFRRRRTGETPGKPQSRPHERAAASASASSTSPMDFWRSGQARTYRDPRAARKSMGLWQRITGFHFPAWMPVATIMVVVLAILGALFFVQSAKGAPRIGDHWHAPYSIYIGDELQPRIQEVVTSEGIHTHGDGVIHIHPHSSVAEGGGAALEHFFGDQGGKLTNSELQIPGRKETYKNGDEVNGQRAELRILRADSGIHPLGGNFSQAIVACDSKPAAEFVRESPRYVPQDGDCIRIVFGPPEVVPVVQPDRTIIDPSQAERVIEMSVTGSGAETVFTPATIDLKAGETVKIVLTNNSQVTQQGDQTIAPNHGMRFSGADRQYGTSDDFVLPNIDPGQGLSGEVTIRFDAPGEYEFRDEQALEGVTPVTGKVIVGEAAATPDPAATPTAVPADISHDVSVTDAAFEPAALTVEAGKSFRINVTNNGSLIHNLCIAGPDGQFRTPGTYPFRDEFNKTIITGTLTVQ